jgi:peptidoglycan/LPS O-acetylase OafA/YrhL
MRLSSLQCLRAIAAWLVVFHHYSQGVFDNDMSASLFGAGFGHFFHYYGKLGVDIFFVISGFIMFYSLNNNKDRSPQVFLIHRVIRVVPVYWFYTFLLVVISLCSFVEMRTEFTPISLFKSLFFIPHNNPSEHLGAFPFLTVGWTLNFEMFFYALLASMLFLFKRKAEFFTFFALLLLPILWGELYLLGFKNILISPYLFEFAIGLLIGNLYCNGDYYPKNNNVIALVFYLLAFSVLYTYGPKEQKYLSVTLIVIATLCIKDSIFNNRFGKFLCKLGNVSYSTYLVHVIILILLISVIGKNPNAVYELVMILLYISVVYLCSVLSHKKLEVGAFNSFLKNYFYQLFKL